MWFRTLTLGLAIIGAPISANAASLTYSDFDTYLSYDATNLDIPVDSADRTQTSTVTGGVLSYSLDSGALTGGNPGVRAFAGLAQGSVNGNFTSSGFDFDLQVNATAQCVINTTAGTCPASVSADSFLEFVLTTDMDASLAVSGNWVGSDGGGVSIIDFFSIQLLRETGNPFNPEELIDIGTNQGGITSDTGTVGTNLQLLAGETYFIKVRNQTNAQSSNSNLFVEDLGTANFTASIAPVPIPAALPLFAGGLGLLGLLGWRRKRIAAAAV